MGINREIKRLIEQNTVMLMQMRRSSILAKWKKKEEEEPMMKYRTIEKGSEHWVVEQDHKGHLALWDSVF